MTTDRIKIKLCMGSSCYSRGNDAIKNTIQEFLRANDLRDEVDFRGHLCKSNCSHGPNLSIGDQEYNNVSESNIVLILTEVFKDKLPANKTQQ